MHVTVVIPVYNRDNFVRAALDSVIAQDYRDWDVLVVDDGSTDRTADAVKSRMSDDRIALIQTTHGGCTSATSIGIERARGPVITILGSDDKLMSDSLSSVMPSFENNPSLGYVWTDWVNSSGKKGGNNCLPSGKTLFQALISGWYLGSVPISFFRKEFYLKSGGLDTSVEFAVGQQLALLIARTGCETLRIPKVTYWRRIHPHRISNEHRAEQLEAGRVLRRRFRGGDAFLAELALEETEKERDALRSELERVRRCFGCRLMRLYGDIIDQALPVGTRFRELKRIVAGRLRGS